MIWIIVTLTAVSVGALAYAYKRKWFFISVTDAEKYEREKPLFK